MIWQEGTRWIVKFKWYHKIIIIAEGRRTDVLNKNQWKDCHHLLECNRLGQDLESHLGCNSSKSQEKAAHRNHQLNLEWG